MNERPNTQYQDEITCPHCGYVYGESYEYQGDDGQELECPECDKRFELSVDHSVTYSTTRVDCDEGHDLEEAAITNTISQRICDAWNAESFLKRTDWAPHQVWRRFCKNCDYSETIETQIGAANPFTEGKRK